MRALDAIRKCFRHNKYLPLVRASFTLRRLLRNRIDIIMASIAVALGEDLAAKSRDLHGTMRGLGQYVVEIYS
ncbi:MAG: hypothetical protein ABWW69_00660 [Pyrodictiaceae archaeon]